MVSIHDAGNVALILSDLQRLSTCRTAEHLVSIYRHPQLGRVLVMDDEIQHVEAWAPLYHEPLVHLPVAFIPKPRNALVLGGGSLFAAAELLKYKSIERILLVDHDSELIDAVCDTYENAAIVRSDPRIEIWPIDVFGALSRIKEQFDLVINDSVDLLRKRGKQTFASMANVLTPSGVCSDVVYRHIFELGGSKRTATLLRSNYRTVLSLIFVPEYPGILHLLTLWGRNKFLSQRRTQTMNREQRGWIASSRRDICSYFDARFLHYYLHLPNWIQKHLEHGLFT